MKVYVLMVGESQEGGGVSGVFKNKQDALQGKLYVMSKDSWCSCDWCDVEEWDVK